MNVKRIIAKAVFGLKKASPEIMMVSGIVGMTGACVLACRSTLKIDDILNETAAKVDTIHKAAEDQKFREEHPEVAGYTEKDRDRDLVTVYIQMGWKLVKLYGPALIVGACSAGLLIGSHGIMKNRLAVLGAASAALCHSYDKYRKEVRERYGEETERDIYYGYHKEKVETVVVGEDGKEKKTKVFKKVFDETKTVDPFTLVFDSRNPNYYPKDPRANKDFLIRVRNYMNDKTQAQGWLFLNDARMMLGFKPVPEGQILGMRYDARNPQMQTEWTIGIEDEGDPEVAAFFRGESDYVVLHLNPEGDITNDFWKFDKSYRVSTIEPTVEEIPTEKEK